MKREKEIIKVSILGVIVNLILVGFKATVGLIAGSISIVLDAVNNLTDAMSSVVTIIGVRLSQKRPDAKHPFGYGRIEYFSALVVAIIVLAAGLVAFKESIEKIITPEEADYSVTSLVIVGIAVIVKFFFGRYVKNKGEKLNSGSLRASGIDAISDAALSLSVLIGALISFFWHVSLEGYIGVIIAIAIIKTAIEILIDAVNDLIGTETDAELRLKLKKTIDSFDDVQGVYDLALHNYGPNKKIATAHIQVADELRTKEIHRLSRQIEIKVFEKCGVILTIGVYAANDSGLAKKMRSFVEETLKDYSTIKQMHGFYLDEEYKVLTFDLIFDFNEREAEEKTKEIRRKIKKRYPDYAVYIILDTDLL